MAKLIEIPEKTCGNGVHYHSPAALPVFHFVQRDGHHGIADLNTVKAWARDIYSGAVPAEEIFRGLYVILPQGRALVPCFIEFTGSGDRLKMAIVGTDSVLGALYTAELAA